jgi:hypothetical protein
LPKLCAGTHLGMTRAHPNPWQWVRYAYGATAGGWLWRYALRVVAQTVPWLVVVTVLLVLFTPLPVGWVLGADAIALGMSLYFTLTSADELVEARLVQHGFPPGTGKSARAHKRG